MSSRQLAILMMLLLTVTLRSAGEVPLPENTGAQRGKPITLTKPSEEHERPALQTVRDFLLTPDGAKIVVHEWRREGREWLDRVVLVEVASGKVLSILLQHKGGFIAPLPLHVTMDSKSLLVGMRNGLGVYDLSSGKLLKRLSTPGGKEILEECSFSDNDDRAVAVSRDAGVVIWDLTSERVSFAKLDAPTDGASIRAFALADRKDLVVSVSPNGKGGKNRIFLLDPTTGKARLISEFEGTFDVLPTSDGKRFFILRDDPQRGVWARVEEWDAAAAKRLSERALPPVAPAAHKLSPDGNRLYLHEDTVRVVLIWSLKLGKPVAAVAPSMGGCEAFDISRDGKKLVAFAGPWKEGTLVPEKLVVFDLSAIGDEKP